MRLTGEIYNAMVDAATAFFGGKTLRFYTGAVQGTFGTAPAGTVLAEITLPNPSHQASAFVAPSNRFIAAISGAWQDASANSSGVIGCFAILDGSTVLCDGSAGASAADIITSLANASAGGAFTVTAFPFRLPPIA